MFSILRSTRIRVRSEKERLKKAIVESVMSKKRIIRIEISVLESVALYRS